MLNDIIEGSLLGDGHITKVSPCFIKPQCLARKEYLEWHYEKLQPYSMPLSVYDSKNKDNGKVYKRAVLRTKTDPLFVGLRKLWYPNGMKKVPCGAIELTELALAIWFFDDGSNSIRKRQAVLHTNAFTDEDCEFLMGKLKERHGIASYLSKRNEIKIRANSYKRITDIVRKFCKWECFLHKTMYRPPAKVSCCQYAADMAADYAAGLIHKQIAEKYGCSRRAVSHVLQKLKYQEINL